MPKKIDAAVRDRVVRLVREHRSEYPSLTAAAAAGARQVGSGTSPCAGGCCKLMSTMASVTG